MTGGRYAILIASDRYPDEPLLEDLRCPENDVDTLGQILSSEVHGQFTETYPLKNLPHHEVLLKINQVLRGAGRDDLVLIYYSGHGKLNQAGRLHLASPNTVVNALEATSIPVDTIRDYVDVSSSNQIVLILDCCFAGAGGEAFNRGGVDDQLQLVSGGRGTYIMTASTGIQVAQEKESDQNGVFTKHIIEGIREGGADLNGDGRIAMDELYNYVHDKVLEEGSQEPMKWAVNVRGQLFVAHSGKTPREDRRRQVRQRLIDLAAEGSLPDDILSKGLEVISLDPDTEFLQSYDALLGSLVQEDISLGEFIGRCYQVRMQEQRGGALPEPPRPEPPPPEPPPPAPISPEPPPPEPTTPETYDIFTGITASWARADISPLAGERQIRSHASWYYGPRQAGDFWAELFGKSKSLILTNRRLILIQVSTVGAFIGAFSRSSQGKVSLEIPLKEIERVEATRRGFSLTFWRWFPYTLPVWLMTRRIEVTYRDGAKSRRIRLHVPDARRWLARIKDIIREDGPFFIS